MMASMMAGHESIHGPSKRGSRSNGGWPTVGVGVVVIVITSKRSFTSERFMGSVVHRADGRGGR